MLFLGRRISNLESCRVLETESVNTDTCKDEIQHLQTWPVDNNFKLNQDKMKEIVIMANRRQVLPPPRLKLLIVLVNQYAAVAALTFYLP